MTNFNDYLKYNIKPKYLPYYSDFHNFDLVLESQTTVE
jgi:hypothetical protein